MKIIITTIDDKHKAEELSKKLLEEKIVACVNRIKTKSVYWYKDKIEENDEFMLMIKTRDDVAEKVMDFVKSIHPYEQPVIELINVEKMNEEAEKWLNEVMNNSN